MKRRVPLVLSLIILNWMNKIIPFCTSGGSGAGRSDTALHKDVSSDVKWAKGKQINRANEAEIRRWLGEVL